MSCLLGNVRLGSSAPLRVTLYDADTGIPLNLNLFHTWSARATHATSLITTAFTGTTIVDSNAGRINLDMATDTFSAGVYDIEIESTEITESKQYIFPYEAGTFKMRVA